MARARWHGGADRSLEWLVGMATTRGAWETCMYQQWTSHGVDQLDVIEDKSHEQELCSGQSWGN